jgi:aminoglycoside 6-adenylyltransferase
MENPVRQAVLDAVVRFAEARETVSALILIGSQARTEMKADEFSDLDFIMVVKDTGEFVHSDSWLRDIGKVHISFQEPTFSGQTEIRAMLDGAQDVDIVIIDEADAARALTNGEAAVILGRGYRVLADKRGLALLPLAPAPKAAFTPAAEADFRDIVNDFWYHVVWSAKKLLRQEIWASKFCVDSYMKQKLLWMIEQHEHAVRRSGADTWYAGRFIDRWAREDILRDLATAFAHYDRADIAAALLNTMRLFRRLALEVAEASGFPYPAHADEYATAWALARLAPLLPDGAEER